jgi:hypothetical protein
VCDLNCGDCCVRIRAAKKLGHKLNGNFCCNAELLPALLQALLCDPCWEVRRAAAWSITSQGARTQVAVVALYISSKLDHHYMVRDQAETALDILTLCRKPCYKELYKAADALIKELRARSIRPGTDGCVAIVETIGQCQTAIAPAANSPEPINAPKVQKTMNTSPTIYQEGMPLLENVPVMRR